MKRLFPLLIPVALLVLNSSCATMLPTVQKYEISATAGAQLTTITGDDADSFENSRIGYNIGLQGRIPIKEKFDFRPGLAFSSEGSNYEDTNFEGTVRLNYLRLNPLVEYRLSDRFGLQGGPSFGLLTSARDIGTTLGTGGSDYDDDISDSISGLDIAAVIGGTYEVSPTVDVFLRANYGLSSVDDFGSSDFGWHNCGLLFGVDISLSNLFGDGTDSTQ